MLWYELLVFDAESFSLCAANGVTAVPWFCGCCCAPNVLLLVLLPKPPPVPEPKVLPVLAPPPKRLPPVVAPAPNAGLFGCEPKSPPPVLAVAPKPVVAVLLVLVLFPNPPKPVLPDVAVEPPKRPPPVVLVAPKAGLAPNGEAFAVFDPKPGAQGC